MNAQWIYWVTSLLRKGETSQRKNLLTFAKTEVEFPNGIQNASPAKTDTVWDLQVTSLLFFLVYWFYWNLIPYHRSYPSMCSISYIGEVATQTESPIS